MAAASAARTRRAASRASAAPSSTTTTCAPPSAWAGGCSAVPGVTSATAQQPHRANERLLEGSVEAGPLERLRDERRLIEWLEPAGAPRDRSAVPVSRCEQVVRLARDARTDEGL